MAWLWTHRKFEVLNNGISKSSCTALLAEQYPSGQLLPAPNSHIAAGLYICKPWEKKRHC